MSKLTNFAENQLIDFMRGETLTLPTGWYAALGSAADDGSFTELAGVGYDRILIARDLASWAGTQGAGTTLASSGTSHATSNNNDIDFGTAGSAWGTASHIGLCDDSSDSECWIYAALPAPLIIGNGDPVLIDAGLLAITIGITGGMSDYLANKLIDLIFRGQAFSWPSSTYVGYTTTAPTNAAAGTEPLGGYARVAVAASLTAWAGTDADGSTAVSTGTSGRTSNNAAITFPSPTGNQGVISHTQILDAATVGNLLFWAALTGGPTTVNAGSQAPSFDPGELGITFA